MKYSRLVVVSNRLPIVLKKDDEGDWIIESGSGGLVTALAPVLRDRGGLWIGWLGTEDFPERVRLDRILSEQSNVTGYGLEPVHLTAEEVELYYHGFSNEILWPLFHDFFSRCNFNPVYWNAYEKVNHRFAQAVADHTNESDYVWIQDYHLILVARELRKMGIKRRTGFFLHVPFPPLDIFLKLPWRFEILDALVQYDLLGFQTIRDRRNFISCVRVLHGAQTSGRGSVRRIITPDRELMAGSFPISIDFNDFARNAASEDVARMAWDIHEYLPNRQLILGIDRLDYTKGIPDRLRALDEALRRYPEMRKKISLIQIVVPSRAGVKEYDMLKQEIEGLIGEINGKYTDVGWIPIHYIFRSLDRTELLGYYRTCEIALITPLKDGMNLVAKEYCACNLEGEGVLILSEFAGSAAELERGALIVNPYDIVGVADTIYRAWSMDYRERVPRMRRMRNIIRRNNIYQWVNSFLKPALGKT
jgi:trehalose 6-phosphate synthase